MKWIKVFYKHCICVIFLIFVLLLEVPCPILALTNVSCPTCGVTRAMLALLKLDINLYLTYQPFALPLVVVALLGIHYKFVRHQKSVKVYIYIVIVSNFVYYLLKLVKYKAVIL